MTTGTRLTLAALAAPLVAGLFSPAAYADDPFDWFFDRDRGDPFLMSVSEMHCGSGQVRVTLRNQTRQAARFDLQSDSRSFANGSIPALKSTTRTVHVGRGSAADIEAFSVSNGSPNTLVDSSRVTNDCAWGHERRRRNCDGWGGNGCHLPFTGPPADFMGKLATAGGLLLTGGIVWWYGSLWPRQSSYSSPYLKRD